MSLPIRSITPNFAVAAQLAPSDLAAAAAMGFKTVINNRPDQEGGDAQPSSTVMAAAAQAAGLAYVYLPVVSGAYTPEQVQAMADAVGTSAQPVLAFCRSGARSTQLFMLSQQAG
jgi:uncharacterized protein (TIGR01244 family)